MAPIRKIFREAFEAVGLPYFNPHSFRKTLALHGERVCQTHEDLKAWSQNFAHKSLLTTLCSYGQVNERWQAEIIRSLGGKKPSGDDHEALARKIAELLSNHKGGDTSKVSVRPGSS
jgi:integrase/recombinase XerD